MGRLRIISVIMLCCVIEGLMTSCANYQYLPEEVRYLPKQPAYQLQGKLPEGAAAGVIDPHSIYLYEAPPYRGEIYYHYYRFWDDGRVLYRSLGMTTLPTLADAESFFGCTVGYYTIDEQELLIEFFIRHPGRQGGSAYLMSEAELVDGDIVKKRSWVRGGLFDSKELREYHPPKIYRKIYMGPMIREPDW